MPLQELPNGALLVPEPALDQVATIMALGSKEAGLIASDGNRFIAKRDDWLTWEMHVANPTIFRSYDKCLRRCQKRNRRLKSDQPRWRPMIWIGADGGPLQELLRQYVESGELVDAPA